MDPFILSKSFKIFPKWRNFAKSGHTGPAKVFFLLSRSHVRLIDRQKHVFATFHTIHRKEEFPPTPLSIDLENIFNFLLLFLRLFCLNCSLNSSLGQYILLLLRRLRTLPNPT